MRIVKPAVQSNEHIQAELAAAHKEVTTLTSSLQAVQNQFCESGAANTELQRKLGDAEQTVLLLQEQMATGEEARAEAVAHLSDSNDQVVELKEQLSVSLSNSKSPNRAARRHTRSSSASSAQELLTDMQELEGIGWRRRNGSSSTGSSTVGSTVGSDDDDIGLPYWKEGPMPSASIRFR